MAHRLRCLGGSRFSHNELLIHADCHRTFGRLRMRSTGRTGLPSSKMLRTRRRTKLAEAYFIVSKSSTARFSPALSSLSQTSVSAGPRSDLTNRDPPPPLSRPAFHRLKINPKSTPCLSACRPTGYLSSGSAARAGSWRQVRWQPPERPEQTVRHYPCAAARR